MDVESSDIRSFCIIINFCSFVSKTGTGIGSLVNMMWMTICFTIVQRRAAQLAVPQPFFFVGGSKIILSYIALLVTRASLS